MKIVPALAILAIIWILAHATPREFAVTGIVLAIASVMYLLRNLPRSRFDSVAHFEGVETVRARTTQHHPLNAIVLAGWCLLAGGLLCTVYFFFFYSTAVDTVFGAVNNLGLMHNRMLGCVVGIGVSIIGTLMALLGRSSN